MDEKNALLEKLEYLRKEYFITAGATQKFELRKRIEELEKRLEKINDDNNLVLNDNEDQAISIQRGNQTENSNEKTLKIKPKEIIYFSFLIVFLAFLYKVQFYEIKSHDTEQGFTQEQSDKFQSETDSMIKTILDSEGIEKNQKSKQALHLIANRRDSILSKIEMNSLNTWRLYYNNYFYCNKIESEVEISNKWYNLKSQPIFIITLIITLISIVFYFFQKFKEKTNN